MYNEESLTKLKSLKELAQRVENDFARKAALDALSGRVDDLVTAGGEPNVITAVKVNGVAQPITDKAVDLKVPTKTSELTNDSTFQTEEQVAASINAKVSSTYKAGGSVAFASLPELAEANLGLVVNVSDKFTTTDSFVEGAGAKHPAGTNVVVVKVGEAYKYDVLAGFVDLSGYVQKVEGKDLSSNDFTDALKNKLDGIAEGATKVEASETAGCVKVNGADVKVVEIATDAEVTEMLTEVFGVQS